MAQVINPQQRKDDALDTIMGGVSIYATATDIKAKAAKAEEEAAMKRRQEKLEKEAASQMKQQQGGV